MSSRLLLITLLAACSGARTTVRWSYVEEVVPIHSVKVVSYFQKDVGYEAMNFAVEKHMRSGLASCHVHAEFWRGIPKADAEADGAAAEERPDARLTVMPWGGMVTKIKTTLGEPVGSSNDVTFKLELFDYRLHKVTWRAEIDFAVDAGYDGPSSLDGKSFVATVLSRMRSDGLLACNAERSDPQVANTNAR